MRKELAKACPKVLRIIENSKKNNRLSHAYLFAGPKGTFKTKMAKYFAMMLYCKEEYPCGECSDCRAILENRHMNVFYIEPLGQSIKKEQIMALQEEFSKTSLVLGPRIYIINEADTMSAAAANSLLKFIEEPTNEETYGILITEHEDNMLQTIVSRSIVINFEAVSKNVLKEQYEALGLEPLSLDIILSLTNNFDEAKALSSKEEFEKLVNTFDKFSTQIFKDGPIGLFYRANSDFLYNKNNMQAFLTLLEKFYRDLYEYQISGSVLTFKSIEEEIKETSMRFTGNVLLKYINQILELEKKMGYNVNINLLFNQLLIDLRGGNI